MSSIVVCSCGKRFHAPDSMAGKKMDCPSCGATLAIPGEEWTITPGNIRVKCPACDSMFQAKPALQGKQLPCPSCQRPLIITPAGESIQVRYEAPPPPAVTSSAAPARDVSPPPKPTVCQPAAGPQPKPTVGGKLAVAVLVIIGMLGFTVRVVHRVVRQQNRFQPVQQQDLQPPQWNIQELTEYPFDESGPFPLKDVPVPEFPRLDPPFRILDSGVQMYAVDMRQAADLGPGSRMRMRVYLPRGLHAPQTLSCVLVAPAGTTLLTGIDLDDEDYFEETLPYVQAGMAVVHYSLDGMPESGLTLDELTSDELSQAYMEFLQARAGVVNGRNALEYVLARLPQVDPKRIYSAGHSSAGTLSLLLAEHEPRISACVAYAPVTNVESYFAPLMGDPVTRFLVGFRAFGRQSSPHTHVARLSCPTFLFHARDDAVVPYATSMIFLGLAKSQGADVSLVTALSGDHYDAMLDEGIPAAIQWLKQQEAGVP